MKGQQRGRQASVGAEDMPDAVPVGLGFDLELGALNIGGRDPGDSNIFLDAGTTEKGAFMVGDVLPPRRARRGEVRTNAQSEELIRRIVGPLGSDALVGNRSSVGR